MISVCTGICLILPFLPNYHNRPLVCVTRSAAGRRARCSAFVLTLYALINHISSHCHNNGYFENKRRGSWKYHICLSWPDAWTWGPFLINPHCNNQLCVFIFRLLLPAMELLGELIQHATRMKALWIQTMLFYEQQHKRRRKQPFVLFLASPRGWLLRSLLLLFSAYAHSSAGNRAMQNLNEYE